MLLAKFFSLFIIILFLGCGVKKVPVAPQNFEEKVIEKDVQNNESTTVSRV